MLFAAFVRFAQRNLVDMKVSLFELIEDMLLDLERTYSMTLPSFPIQAFHMDLGMLMPLSELCFRVDAFHMLRFGFQLRLGTLVGQAYTTWRFRASLCQVASHTDLGRCNPA